MKPFLGIDLTTEKNNAEWNGAEFCIQKPSAGLTRSLETSAQQVDSVLKEAKLPGFFRAVQFVCGICAMLIVTGFLDAEVTLAEGYRNAPGLYWACGVSGAVWLVLWVWSRGRAKAVLENQEKTHILSNFEGVAQAVYRELSVPEDAKNVDVLSFFYKEKGGKIKVVEHNLQVPYQNQEFKLFVEGETLCLADLYGKYAFSLASLQKRERVKKRIRLADWNKEEPWNKGAYKKYKIVRDNGGIHCKGYEIVTFRHNGTQWSIYFPDYEEAALDAVLPKVTGTA